ncbi:ATP-binding protein [Dactylosporangium sp. McL0621]|uniref:ATP-binding protein n=1 Tax=Dactylosporangium sp. McL0621 TaxID=3415678 RepID=UPI003CEDF414
MRLRAGRRGKGTPAPFAAAGGDDERCERQILRRDGSRVWITTRVLHVHTGGYVVLESVESTERHALADPAARSQDEARRLARAERDAAKVRGTGLGLYIVRNLAQANGADVHHEPNPGGGAQFVLDLEAAQA